eukprot:403372685
MSNSVSSAFSVFKNLNFEVPQNQQQDINVQASVQNQGFSNDVNLNAQRFNLLNQQNFNPSASIINPNQNQQENLYTQRLNQLLNQTWQLTQILFANLVHFSNNPQNLIQDFGQNGVLFGGQLQNVNNLQGQVGRNPQQLDPRLNEIINQHVQPIDYDANPRYRRPPGSLDKSTDSSDQQNTDRPIQIEFQENNDFIFSDIWSEQKEESKKDYCKSEIIHSRQAFEEFKNQSNNDYVLEEEKEQLKVQAIDSIQISGQIISRNPSQRQSNSDSSFEVFKLPSNSNSSSGDDEKSKNSSGSQNSDISRSDYLYKEYIKQLLRNIDEEEEMKEQQSQFELNADEKPQFQEEELKQYEINALTNIQSKNSDIEINFARTQDQHDSSNNGSYIREEIQEMQYKNINVSKNFNQQAQSEVKKGGFKAYKQTNENQNYVLRTQEQLKTIREKNHLRKQISQTTILSDSFIQVKNYKKQIQKQAKIQENLSNSISSSQVSFVVVSDQNEFMDKQNVISPELNKDSKDQIKEYKMYQSIIDTSAIQQSNDTNKSFIQKRKECIKCKALKTNQIQMTACTHSFCKDCHLNVICKNVSRGRVVNMSCMIRFCPGYYSEQQIFEILCTSNKENIFKIYQIKRNIQMQQIMMMQTSAQQQRSKLEKDQATDKKDQSKDQQEESKTIALLNDGDQTLARQSRFEKSQGVKRETTRSPSKIANFMNRALNNQQQFNTQVQLPNNQSKIQKKQRQRTSRSIETRNNEQQPESSFLVAQNKSVANTTTDQNADRLRAYTVNQDSTQSPSFQPLSYQYLESQDTATQRNQIAQNNGQAADQSQQNIQIVNIDELIPDSFIQQRISNNLPSEVSLNQNQQSLIEKLTQKSDQLTVIQQKLENANQKHQVALKLQSLIAQVKGQGYFQNELLLKQNTQQSKLQLIREVSQRNTSLKIYTEDYILMCLDFMFDQFKRYSEINLVQRNSNQNPNSQIEEFKGQVDNSNMINQNTRPNQQHQQIREVQNFMNTIHASNTVIKSSNQSIASSSIESSFYSRNTISSQNQNQAQNNNNAFQNNFASQNSNFDNSILRHLNLHDFKKLNVNDQLQVLQYSQQGHSLLRSTQLQSNLQQTLGTWQSRIQNIQLQSNSTLLNISDDRVFIEQFRLNSQAIEISLRRTKNSILKNQRDIEKNHQAFQIQNQNPVQVLIQEVNLLNQQQPSSNLLNQNRISHRVQPAQQVVGMQRDKSISKTRQFLRSLSPIIKEVGKAVTQLGAKQTAFLGGTAQFNLHK